MIDPIKVLIYEKLVKDMNFDPQHTPGFISSKKTLGDIVKDINKDFDPAEACDLAACEYCSRETYLRVEPFGSRKACKPCWEQICYGG